MAAYRVVAPYVTLKVRDQLGAWVLAGFYEGGVVSEVDPASLQHHLDSGMVEEVDEPAPAEPVEPPAPVEPAPVVRPGQAAVKAAWVAYAVTQRPEGMSEEDARTEADDMSKADLIAKFGG